MPPHRATHHSFRHNVPGLEWEERSGEPRGPTADHFFAKKVVGGKIVEQRDIPSPPYDRRFVSRLSPEREIVISGAALGLVADSVLADLAHERPSVILLGQHDDGGRHHQWWFYSHDVVVMDYDIEELLMCAFLMDNCSSII